MEQVDYLWVYVNFEVLERAFQWSLYDLEYEAKAIFSHSMCTVYFDQYTIIKEVYFRYLLTFFNMRHF
jgi:hypothetical protein